MTIITTKHSRTQHPAAAAQTAAVVPATVAPVATAPGLPADMGPRRAFRTFRALQALGAFLAVPAILVLALGPGTAAASGGKSGGKTKPKNEKKQSAKPEQSPGPGPGDSSDSGPGAGAYAGWDADSDAGAADEAARAIRVLATVQPAYAQPAPAPAPQQPSMKLGAKHFRLKLLSYGPSAEILAKGKSVRNAGIAIVVFGSLSLVVAMTVGVGHLIVAADISADEEWYTDDDYGDPEMTKGEFDEVVSYARNVGIGVGAGGLALGTVLLSLGISFIRRMEGCFLDAVKAWDAGNPDDPILGKPRVALSPMLGKGTLGLALSATF